MALPNEIDKSLPGNNDDPSQGAGEIRSLKEFLQDLFGLVDATNYTVAPISISPAGVITFNVSPVMSPLSASLPVFTDASKNLTTQTLPQLASALGISPTQTTRGMLLRTHPDSDKAATYIQLVHAEEIVLHDGFRIAPTDLQTAVKDGSTGAGHLDTGSWVNSTWYQVIFGRKSSDGTQGVWFHRAKDWYLDPVNQQTTNAAVDALRRATSTTTDQHAQSFQVGTAGLLTAIDVLLETNSTAVTGNFWVTVEADSAGSPSGTPLAISDKFNAGGINTAYQWVKFLFRTPTTLATSTTYWLVMQGDYTRSDSVAIDWAGNTSDSYASGVAKRYNGSAWSGPPSNGIYDFTFKLYTERNNTTIASALPSGYDQYAHIGWVYCNSGGNFDPLVFLDRRCIPLTTGSLGTSTPNVPTLIDCTALLPPIPVRPRFGYAGAGQQWFGIGPVPGGQAMVVSNGTDRGNLAGGVGGIPQYAASTSLQGVTDSLQTEAQAVYIVQAGATAFQFWLSSWEW